MDRTVNMGFSNATSLTTQERKEMEKSITANQAYKQAGGQAGTGLKFSDWLNQEKESGNLDKLLTAARGIDWKSLFGKGGREGNTFVDPTPPARVDTPPADELRILGMPKGVAIVAGIAALTLLGFGIYKLATKN